jgi:hypothetical protein
MIKKEMMIKEKIQKTGITSVNECFVKYKAFPSVTKKVVRQMIKEGYNISIVDDHIDLSFFWLDCDKNMIFPQKRILN